MDFARQARISLEGAAHFIRQAGLFDEDFYSASGVARRVGIDPAVHYLQTGEPAGLRPAARFDPGYYRAKYPDVAPSGLSPLVHFARFGIGQRRTLPIAADFSFPTSGLKRERETVLLLVPDASRSPVAVLAGNICQRISNRFNVIMVLMNGGEMAGAFSAEAAGLVRARSEAPVEWDFMEGGYLARQLISIYRPKMSIATSRFAQPLVPAIARCFVPVITLVDEVSPVGPKGSLSLLCHNSAAIVFSSDVAKEAWSSDYPILSEREILVAPFGVAAMGVSADDIVPAERARDPEIESLAEEAFFSDPDLSAIIEYGIGYAERTKTQAADLEVILRSGVFDPDFFLGGANASGNPSIGDLVRAYIVASTPMLHSSRQSEFPNLRKGVPGFNPLIYARECGAYSPALGENALAHYIRRGLPEGRWKHAVIAPGVRGDEVLPDLRVGLHGHFHYPELFPDFLARLTSNRMRVDLMVTTDNEEKCAAIRQAAAGYDLGEVEIRLVPNLGRDLGAFLTGFADRVLDTYDVIGHLHGKRSLAGFAGRPGNGGERWREFLWENLIGARRPMVDMIVRRFANDPGLGMVFPEDANLFGWTSNREPAEELAQKLGIATPLPSAIDFPAGNMFWARPEALRPLCEMKLNWSDYPAEPLPLDGTMLHALERLLPLIVTQKGFSYATTQVDGVNL